MKKTTLKLSAGLVLLGASLAFFPAIAQKVASTDQKSVKPGAYVVEPGHTQVEFSISHMGFTNYSGMLSGASGTMQIDPANLATSKLDVSVPVQSIVTTVPKLDEELKGAQWFDANQFPTASFTSTKIVPVSSTTAIVSGNLTLHGVTKPVTLKARFIGAGVNPLDKSFTVGFEATSNIKRSDFGLSTYLPLIGDDVTLRIAGAFVLKS